MQLDLTDDQTLFRETTARFIDAELPLPATRALHDDPLGFDRGWLRNGAELGWFSMLVAEDLGGGSVSGDGVLDAAILAEELGRQVQPGPFVTMNIVASALAAHGSGATRADVLSGIVAGELVATWAFAGADGSWDEGAGVQARRSGSQVVLSGTRGFVLEAPSADWFLVTCSLDGEPAQALVAADAAGVGVRPLNCLDLSRRMAHLELDAVEVGADAVLAGAADAMDDQLLIALVLNCAETVGAMDALFTMTVEYAKDRIAFGRPIGSFQALKHLMADQALQLESCKAGAVAAARAVQGGRDSAAEVASMAAAYIGDVGNELAQECLQIHGGIGYTWEHDLHLFLRRIRSNSALYGEPTWHRERVCAQHRLGLEQGS